MWSLTRTQYIGSVCYYEGARQNSLEKNNNQKENAGSRVERIGTCKAAVCRRHSPQSTSQFDFEITEPKYDMLKFYVYDYDKYSTNDFLGEASLSALAILNW